MKRLRKLLALTAVMMAVGTFVSAGPASAATGPGSSTVIINNIPCTVSFTWDTGSGNPPPPTGSPATLSNFSTSMCPFSIVEPPTTLTITFGSGGVATWSGTVRINTSGIICTYPVSGFTGSHSGTDPVNAIGTGLAYKSSGSFLCPSSATFDMDVYLYITV